MLVVPPLFPISLFKDQTRNKRKNTLRTASIVNGANGSKQNSELIERVQLKRDSHETNTEKHCGFN